MTVDGVILALKGRKFGDVLSTLSITTAHQAQIAFSSKVFRLPTSLVADGTYDRIAKKYFDFDVYGQ